MKKTIYLVILTLLLSLSVAEAKGKKERGAKAKTEKTEKTTKKAIRCKRTRGTGTRMSSQICMDEKQRAQARKDSQDSIQRATERPSQIPGVSGG